jgi:hypothetical protein
MKKLLFLGLLSAAALGAFAPESQAWCLGCWRDRHCCSRYSTRLCIRPYNAFSPVAYGNIVADGCMPVNVFGGQLPGMGMPSVFGPGFGGGCCTSGCCVPGCGDSGCLPAPGGFASAPQQGVPGQPLPQGQPGQQFAPPNPQPLGQTRFLMPPAVPAYGYGYAPVQPVGYYVPMATPQYMYGYGYQAPSYWYGQ